MNPNSQVSSQTEPDPDAIKMFVGQIPKNMYENDLKKMFEEYGSVYHLNVLRDKNTGQSKGCCFVTFYTRKAALDAQNALHNVKTMPMMHHPIQMKPADSEKRNGDMNAEDRKLFVGMLSKKLNENDVRMMFAPFGTIEDCTVLRDATSTSKGCAFITFASKVCALNAIKGMHHSQTMEGCSSPLVVKIADTQKEKEQKKMQQMASNLLMQMSSLGALGPQCLAFLQQASGNNMGGNFNMGNMGNALNAVGVQQLLAAAAAASNNPASMNTMGNQNMPYSSGHNNSASFPNVFNPQAQMQQNVVAKQSEGPDGANLFIYHLPQEFGDSDLMQMFMPFGNVVSAKVFIDKQTNLSKCFGFVSYDSPMSAQAAITSMNGFQIGMKRLKVQLKRPKNDKPY